jgi:hypothetical protein
LGGSIIKIASRKRAHEQVSSESTSATDHDLLRQAGGTSPHALRMVCAQARRVCWRGKSGGSTSDKGGEHKLNTTTPLVLDFGRVIILT